MLVQLPGLNSPHCKKLLKDNDLTMTKRVQWNHYFSFSESGLLIGSKVVDLLTFSCQHTGSMAMMCIFTLAQ